MLGVDKYASIHHIYFIVPGIFKLLQALVKIAWFKRLNTSIWSLPESAQIEIVSRCNVRESQAEVPIAPGDQQIVQMAAVQRQVDDRDARLRIILFSLKLEESIRLNLTTFVFSFRDEFETNFIFTKLFPY